MAVYNLSTKKEKPKKPKKDINKTVGIILLTVSTVIFVVLLTSYFETLKSFVLGFFGLFAYPLFITTFVVGLALFNNKKYVMTTRYVVYFCCLVLAVLCILHMLFINTSGTFFEYLARSYNKKITAGGFLCGLLTAPFIFILDKIGAYIVYSIVLVIFGALLADYIYYLKKSSLVKMPTQIKIQSVEQIDSKLAKFNEEKKTKEKVNIVLEAKVKNEQFDDAAKRKLGLIKSSGIVEEKEEDKLANSEIIDKKDVRKFLLSPNNVDMSKFNPLSKTPVMTEDMKQTMQTVKEDGIETKNDMPNIVVHDYSSSFNGMPETNINQDKPFMEPENLEEGEDNSVFEDNDFAQNIIQSLIDETKLESDEKPIVSESLVKSQSLKEKSDFVAPKQEQQKIDLTEEEKPVIKPKKNVRYIKPSYDLLTTCSKDLSILNEDVMQKSDQLESTLDSFGIPAKIINVVVGPAVTRYELEMPAGVSVKKLLAHSDDIAYNLAANGDIRIEAPIPGKMAVGIEVPNKAIATIGFKNMVMSEEFQNNRNPLTFVLGKDISGAVRLCNLQSMPHLLIAGSTGSGKSVCLNAVILSLIYKTSPDDVRLILIDPKQVEFSIYNGLPHLLVPSVITDSEKALNSLTWAVNEMERRYNLFKNTRTKSLEEYCSCSDVLEGRCEKLPYIVIIIDEVADLLMTAKKDVEEKIARLAQKARAAGIHLILATQRPSVDVITGTMKNNFPSRITFRLTSAADSKTVLDQGGAEKLLGRGDMLYKPSDASEPRRIQGCFVTSNEIANIVDYVKESNKDYDYDDKVQTAIFNPPKQDVMSMANGELPCDNTGFDPLMSQALRCVIENGQASISMLQRKLLLGYPRAARIIDQMEQQGFVSVQDGSKPRQVIITMEQFEEMFGDEE